VLEAIPSSEAKASKNETAIMSRLYRTRTCKAKKPYANLSKYELVEATADLSAGAIPPGAPLTAEERAKWDRAAAGNTVSVRVGPGRPKVGEGSVVVPISLEAGLLRRALVFASDAGVKRSELVARALELLLDAATEIGGKKVGVRRPLAGRGNVAKRANHGAELTDRRGLGRRGGMAGREAEQPDWLRGMLTLSKQIPNIPTTRGGSGVARAEEVSAAGCAATYIQVAAASSGSEFQRQDAAAT